MSYVIGSSDENLRVTVTEATDLVTINITPAIIDFAGGAGQVFSVNGQSGIVVLDTDDIAEGVTNLYYDNALVDTHLADGTITDIKSSQFTVTGGTGTQGQITWNSDEETLDIIQNGAVLQVGQETQWHCRNNTGVTIPNGTAVMATGSIGASGRITVAPMVADGSISSRYFLGITTEDIGIGEDGKVTVLGKVRGLNTSMWLDGDTLWLDPAVPGGLTNVQPTAPNLKIPAAFVIHSSATVGTLAVRANEGHDLHESHDVHAVGTLDGQALLWSAANNRWENKDVVVDLTGYATETFVTTQGYLTNESDPIFNASPAGSILAGDITNWNTAHGWGNHASAGYLTAETDPVFSASAASSILAGDITNWNNAFGWGNHALAGYELASNKGIAGGYASLDGSGFVPSSQLPSYVDDVLEYANFAALPVTGETGKIYITLDNNKVYRWSGTVYIEIVASPGTTDDVAEGVTNLYYTDVRARAALSATGSLSYNSTTGEFSYTQPTNVSTFTNDAGYLTSETSHADVVVDGDFISEGLMRRGATSGTYSIVTDNSANWDTAYGWGDHALAGYASTTYVDVAVAGKQEADAGLSSIAGLTTSADQMIYTTASDTYATTGLTAFSRSLLDNATMQEWRDDLNILTLTSIVPIANGATVSPTSIGISSDGVNVTLSFEKAGGGDVNVFFSGVDVTIPTTPAATVNLTVGTDTVPVLNYVYIPESTKVLTVGTDWPSGASYAPIATVLVPSAAYVQTDSVYKLHYWTDHLADSLGTGHLAHINYWIRNQPATWHKGIALTPSVVTQPAAADDIWVTTATGEVLQLHETDFPAFNTQTGSHMHVINHPTTPYLEISNMNVLTVDSNNVAITNNKWATFVIWGVQSSTANDCQLMVNLPTAWHTSEADALADGERYTVYDIPQSFLGTGFLIARLTFKYTTANSGTWVLVQNRDLRGQIPTTLSGGGSGGGVSSLAALTDVNITTPVTDNSLLQYDTATGAWINQIANVSSLTNDAGYLTTVALNDLTDVTITSPTSGAVLSYGAGTWSETVLGLNFNSDVNITSPATDQVLKYNGTTWVNATAPAGASDLDGLTDVVITTPVTDQVLKYNGTNWVNATGGGGATALDDLTDVAINVGLLGDGDILRYNGTASEWQNTNIGISLAPTFGACQTAFYANHMMAVKLIGTYDQPSWEIILVKPDLSEVTYPVSAVRTAVSGPTLRSSESGKAFIGSGQYLNLILPADVGNYTLKVRVQDFGDLPSEVATYNFTAAAVPSFNPSDISARYIRLTTTRETTGTGQTSPYMIDSYLIANQYPQINNLSFFTGTAGTGTNLPSDMTSDTAPAPYVITYSSVFANSSSYYGWKAFDSSFSTQWWGYTSAGPDWIQVDFGSAQTIKSMGIYQSALTYLTYGFKVEVSDTGAFAGEQTEVFSIDGFVPDATNNTDTILG